MSVFYVLPPRPVLGECLASLWRPFVPGANVRPDLCADFVDSLVSSCPPEDDCHVVYREELPDGEEVESALRHGFGAEEGDHVVYVSIGPRAVEPRVKMWRLKAA